MINDPQINILLGAYGLTNIVSVASATWTTRTRRGTGVRSYTNAIFKAYDSAKGQEVYVLAARPTQFNDWEIRIRIPASRVIEVDVTNALLAYKADGHIRVSNGKQTVHEADVLIPTNRPKVLREFAQKILDENK
jgi:hypothetical protein